MKRLTTNHMAGGVLIIAATLLYLFTLDNGLQPDELTGGDLITHQYAQLQARPSNAPGYPLYTMGGWLWFRLGRILLPGIMNPIQILSFYSTLWALASLLLLYAILLKVGLGDDISAKKSQVGNAEQKIQSPSPDGSSSNSHQPLPGVGRRTFNQPWLIALSLSAFYATTFFFWFYSVTTEQYTSAVFQTLLVIWLAFKWDETPQDSTLLWLAFISGTMLANMVTTLFILPPLLWFIFFRHRDKQLLLLATLKRPKLIFQAIALALLPLASYGYIYIRGALHPEWRGVGQWSSTWAWFIQFITIRQGRDELAPGLSLQTIFTQEFPTLMGQELTWIILIGGLFGLATLGRRRAIFLYSTLFIYLLFSWGYRFGNWFQVIIPAYPIFIIGFAAAARWVIEKFKGRYKPLIRGMTILLLAGLLIYRFSLSHPNANQRNRAGDSGLDPGWSLIADNPVPPALISGTFEERVALEYLRAVRLVEEGIMPVDVVDLNPDQSSDIPIFVSRQAAAASPKAIHSETVHPQAAGDQLIALLGNPRSQPGPTAKVTRLDFGNNLQLVGWERPERQSSMPAEVARRLSPANWRVGLYWRTSAKLTADYTVSVRPLVAGQLIMAGDAAVIQDHQPVWGHYPTSRWRAGEIVRDDYALTVPDGIVPDAFQIIIYEVTEAGFQNLGTQTISLIE